MRVSATAFDFFSRVWTTQNKCPATGARISAACAVGVQINRFNGSPSLRKNIAFVSDAKLSGSAKECEGGGRRTLMPRMIRKTKHHGEKSPMDHRQSQPFDSKIANQWFRCGAMAGLALVLTPCIGMFSVDLFDQRDTGAVGSMAVVSAACLAPLVSAFCGGVACVAGFLWHSTR